MWNWRAIEVVLGLAMIPSIWGCAGESAGPSSPPSGQSQVVSDASAPPPPPAPSVSTAPPPPPAPVITPAETENAARTLSPLPGSRPSSVTRSSSSLQYDWNTGPSYAGYFTLTASLGQEELKYSGMVVYQFSGVPTGTGSIPTRSAATRGSGTGFLVHPDGALLTCYHVVRDATQIEVILNSGASHRGRVAASDPEQDLAIVRIEARGLPHIALGESDQVQLAEAIRVIGYPLSNLLGESIKVTRGEISGRANVAKAGQLLQVDATINPGNSGGPVVDRFGNVVGIANALLSGESIAEVGFAIPINKAASLLRKQQIDYLPPQSREALDGPRLMQKVSPAVALLKVTQGGTTVSRSNGSRHSVSYSGHYSPMSSPGSFSPTSFGEIVHDSGSLTVDELGNIASDEGQQQLPFTMQDLGSVGIEPLPSGNQRSWSATRPISIYYVKQAEEIPSNSPFSRLRYDPLRRFRRRSTVTAVVTLSATERISYRQVGESNGLVEFAKTYDLQTTAGSSGAPAMHVTGNATYQFDRQHGLIRGVNLKGKYMLNGENISLTIPHEFVYEGKDPGQYAETRQRVARQQEERKRKDQEEAQTYKTGLGESQETKRIPELSSSLDKYNPDD